MEEGEMEVYMTPPSKGRTIVILALVAAAVAIAVYAAMPGLMASS